MVMTQSEAITAAATITWKTIIAIPAHLSPPLVGGRFDAGHCGRQFLTKIEAVGTAIGRG
jgi:hypothetical protein